MYIRSVDVKKLGFETVDVNSGEKHIQLQCDLATSITDKFKLNCTWKLITIIFSQKNKVLLVAVGW
jgi:hypothetical protein